MSPTYSYQDSGFDKFLSRSIDDLSQSNLSVGGPVSNSIAYDRNQVSGQLGDTLQIGSIRLNGSDQNIILSDSNNVRLLIGRQDGGF